MKDIRFESPRAVAERKRHERYEVFDMMADLTLSGTVSLKSAIESYCSLVELTEPELQEAGNA